MFEVRLRVPDGVMSMIKYAKAATRLNQEDVIVTILQIGLAGVRFEDLPETVAEVYRQTQVKLRLEQEAKIQKGV